MDWTMKFGCRSKLFFRAATVVAIWILCWVCVMGIPCWSAQVSLVEAVEAQQVRLQVTSTTAASHIPAPRSSKKSRIFWFRWLSLPPSQVMFLYNIYTHHIYIRHSDFRHAIHIIYIYIYVCMYKVYLFILYIDLYSIYFTYVLLTIYIYDSGFISYIYIYIVYIYIYIIGSYIFAFYYIYIYICIY